MVFCFCFVCFKRIRLDYCNWKMREFANFLILCNVWHKRSSYQGIRFRIIHAKVEYSINFIVNFHFNMRKLENCLPAGKDGLLVWTTWFQHSTCVCVCVFEQLVLRSIMTTLLLLLLLLLLLFNHIYYVISMLLSLSTVVSRTFLRSNYLHLRSVLFMNTYFFWMITHIINCWCNQEFL